MSAVGFQIVCGESILWKYVCGLSRLFAPKKLTLEFHFSMNFLGCAGEWTHRCLGEWAVVARGTAVCWLAHPHRCLLGSPCWVPRPGRAWGRSPEVLLTWGGSSLKEVAPVDSVKWQKLIEAKRVFSVWNLLETIISNLVDWIYTSSWDSWFISITEKIDQRQGIRTAMENQLSECWQLLCLPPPANVAGLYVSVSILTLNYNTSVKYGNKNLHARIQSFHLKVKEFICSHSRLLG